MQGKQIVVTRAPQQADDLADLLRGQGAEPLLYPCIDIQPPEDTTELDQALRDAAKGAFDWVVLTSSNTVEILRRRCDTLGLSLAQLPAAAIGPGTAEAARSVLGLDVQIMPDEHVAEALAESLNIAPGTRIFLPQANIARETLHDLLAAAGAEVSVVSAYQTVIGHGGVDLSALLRDGQIDALTFTSSSTVTNCVQRLQNEGGDPVLLAEIVSACIGPKTAQTAREAGLSRVLVPEAYTLAGLVSVLASAFA